MVGVVGGLETVPPVVRFVNAFEAGAKAINPDVKVLKIYNESFTDPTKGASDAKQFIGEGADVIFGAGGKTGSGAVSEATTKGKWGIGVDQDEYYTTFNSGAAPGSKYLASSAVKRVDLGVFDNIVAQLKGEFKGGAFSLTAANDGITYAPFHDATIPDDVAAKLEEVRQGPRRRLDRHRVSTRSPVCRSEASLPATSCEARLGRVSHASAGLGDA